LRKSPKKCDQHILEVLGYYSDNPGLLIWGCRHCGKRIEGEEHEEDNKAGSEGNSSEDSGGC
jgi:hypothetical protein